MLICCSSPMIPGDTLTRKADLLRSWGYDAIAVFQDRADWNAEVHRELAELEPRTGIRPVEFVLTGDIYGHAMSDDRSLRTQCRDLYRKAADVCAELGLVTEIEFQCHPQDPMPLFDPYQQPSAELQASFDEFYRELLARVEGSSGAVLLEPLNRYESRYLNSVADNLSVLERVGHPNAGLLPDTFHLSIEEASIPDALRKAGDQVRHVHLGDSNRLLPGRGALDWPAIFQALHDALAAEGADVALFDLLDTVEDTARQIAAEHGVRALGHRLNVTDQEATSAAFDLVAERLGVPQVLLTAAGIEINEDSVDVTADHWRSVIDVNLTGTFFSAQAFGRALLNAGLPGSAVLISSMSGSIVNVPQWAASYNSSKAAVAHLGASLAVEWAAAGIRVNSIAPGYVLTDLTRQIIERDPSLEADWISRIPQGRMATPEDLAGLVIFLASDASSYLTAQQITIDGGYTAI